MATRLYLGRKKLKLSQAEAARAIGTNRLVYGTAERGRLVLSPEQRAALAELYGESEAKLFYESGLARGVN